MAGKNSDRYEVFELADILDDSRPRSIRVRFVNGKTAWLPRAKITFGPGRVFLPQWLATKIRKHLPVPDNHRRGRNCVEVRNV